MSKVITDIYGFAQAIQRQVGCDREVIEALCDRFSENVVIAGDRYAVATQILEIAQGAGYTAAWVDPANIVADPDVEFDKIIDEYRETDQDDVGYSYFSLREAIQTVYTDEECLEIAARSAQ